jgi:NAD(P)-dependent dehydrogenase (short-subunit alcohol dehydrogenase family)
MAFHGKVALVTGAGSGLGRLAARRLAAAGASVAAVDIDEKGLQETAAHHEAEGGPSLGETVSVTGLREEVLRRQTMRTSTLDVTDAPAVQAAVKEIESELGPIDRVFNAAAIMPTALILDHDLDEIHRIMRINYGGLVNVTKATLPGMLERGRGDLIQFASMAGWVPSPHFGAYDASKFAVVAFSEVLYHENRGKGVRIVCVCPPPVATPLLDQATSQPRLLEKFPPIRPEVVLESIERSLEAGRLWAFPGRGTSLLWRLRRFAPGLVWRRMHRIEGL